MSASVAVGKDWVCELLTSRTCQHDVMAGVRPSHPTLQGAVGKTKDELFWSLDVKTILSFESCHDSIVFSLESSPFLDEFLGTRLVFSF